MTSAVSKENSSGRSASQSSEPAKQNWLLFSTLLNALLAGLKFVWGFYTANTIVIADAVHSLSDVVGALFIFLAIRFSKHRSVRFPYGLNKLEDVAAIAGGVFVTLAGYEIIRRVFVSEPIPTPRQPLATILFMAGVMLVILIFYSFEKRAAQKLNSPGIGADAANWLGDLASSLVVVVGMAGILADVPYVQQMTVVVLALFIFKSAYQIMKRSILSLLDVSADPVEIRKIRDIILRYPEVREIQDLKVTPAGSVYFVTASIAIDEKNLKEAHTLVDRIAEDIKSSVANIEDVLIHYEPVRKKFERYAVLLDADKKTASREFGKTTWILFLDRAPDGRILERKYVRNPFASAERGKGIRLVAYLIDRDIDYLILSREARSSSLSKILEDVGIRVHPDDEFLKHLEDAGLEQP